MRYVIALDTTLKPVEDNPKLCSGIRLVAPTLLRSELVAALYRSIRAGQIDREEAGLRLDRFRALKPRLLGDRVLQSTAMNIATALDWDDTLQAEYLALTRLQADAFVTRDAALTRIAETVVPVAPYKALLA